MNLTRLLLGLLILLPFAAGCDDTDGSGETLTLEVTVAAWNGWDPDDKPTPETSTVEVSEGSSFEVEALDAITFEVTSIDDDQLELGSDADLALRNAHGGIDVNHPVDEFTLDRAGTLELSTPTLDAGIDITIEVA